MGTTHIILTGEHWHTTYVHVGPTVGTLSLAGQHFSVEGSGANNAFFLYPAGYSFEFLNGGGGSDRIYLTGNRSDYFVEFGNDGTKTLTRGSGDTSESVTVPNNNLFCVFADGWIWASNLSAGVDETSSISDTDTSVSPWASEWANQGGVRIAVSGGSGGETNVLSPSQGIVFATDGNGGVDEVFVSAGAHVDATSLGGAKDKIFLEGALNDYLGSFLGNYEGMLNGNQMTLSRTFLNVLTNENDDEIVHVLGGIGASNDRLLFSDGSIDTRDLLLALRAGRSAGSIIADTGIWDSTSTSFSSALPLEGGGNLTLLLDSGTDGDGVTNDGTIVVSGVTEGYVWQYRIGGNGNAWQMGSGTTFELPGQESGEAGRTYEIGEVEVRQVSPFGVASSSVSNDQVIIVDRFAETGSVGIQSAPALIESATFDNGDLLIGGTATDGIASLSVVLTDGQGNSTAPVLVNVDMQAGTWEAAFTQTQMAGLQDGSSARLVVTATDIAGNLSGSVESSEFVIELENQDPVSNSSVEIAPTLVGWGVQGATGGTLLLDLASLPGGEAAFADSDAGGSANATLSYSARLTGGGSWPDWLEVTSDGKVRIADGRTTPEFGSLSITITATDGAGAAAERNIVLQQPAAPDLIADSDTGILDTDNLTKDTTPTISGSLPENLSSGTVSVLIDGAVVATSTQDGVSVDGLTLDFQTHQWTYTPETPLDIDSASASVTLEFSISINGERSPSLPVTFDTQPPESEVAISIDVPALTLGNTDGDGNGGLEFLTTMPADFTVAAWVFIGDQDGITSTGSESQVIFSANDDLSLRINPGGSMVLDRDGTIVDTGFVASTGWHFIAMTEGNGANEVYLDGVRSLADLGGQIGSGFSSSFWFGRGASDGQAPLVGGAFRDVMILDTVLDEAALETIRSGTPVDTANSNLLGYWPLSQSGSATYANALPGGDSLTPLGSPTVDNIDGTGFQGSVTANNRLTVNGSGAEAHARVRVTADDGQTQLAFTTVADASGDWSVELYLAPASTTDYVLTAGQEDDAGNTSAASSSVTVRVPTTPLLAPQSDTGLSGDFITLDLTPTVSGTLPAGYVEGDDFDVYVDGSIADPSGLVVNTGEGTWTYTPTSDLPPGEHTFESKINGVFSGALEVTLIAPEAPDLDAGSDSGISQTDNLTNVTSPVLTGVLPEGTAAGVPVIVYRDGIQQALATDGTAQDGLSIDYEQGTWTYTEDDTLESRDYSYSISVAGTRSEQLAVTIDAVTDDVPLPQVPGGMVNAFLLSSDGIDNAVAPRLFYDIGDAFTMAFWIYVDNPAGTGSAAQMLFSTGGNLEAWIAADGSGRLEIRSGIVTHETSETVAPGWHYFAATASSSGRSVYINGNEVFSDENPLTGMFSFLFGYDFLTPDNDQPVIDGAISDVQAWSRVLTGQELDAAYAGKVDITDTDLVGYWPLSTPVQDENQFENEKAGGPNLNASRFATIGLVDDADGYGGRAAYFSAGNPVLRGSGALPEAQVIISIDDGVSAHDVETLSDSAGTWSVQLDLNPEIETTYQISVRQMDAAGNMAETPTVTSLTINPVQPATPGLSQETDSGTQGDGRTANRQPEFTGTLPQGTQEGVTIAVKVGDAPEVAGSVQGDNGNGLSIDYVSGNWSYALGEDLALGDHRVTVSVDGVSSTAFVVTIFESAPSITDTPVLIEDASFASGDLELSGQAGSDVHSITIQWDDNDSGTADPQVADILVNANGNWSAAFSRQDLESMVDGTSVRFTVTAKDENGLVLGTTVSGDIALELDNEAPEANGAVQVETLVVGAGNPGNVGGTLLLDLTNVNGGSEMAFLDHDAPGSANAALLYTAKLIDGSDLPDWLEVTQAGVVQVVDGLTVPELETHLTVRVTATDGEGASGHRDFVVDTVGTPQLAESSDTGVVGDGITKVDRPVLTGRLPFGTEEGIPVSFFVGNNPIASTTATTTGGAFEVDYQAGTWTYTFPSTLDERDYSGWYRLDVDGIKSGYVSFVIDRTVDPVGSPDSLQLDGSVPMSGQAEPAATVELTFSQGGVTQTIEVVADGDGAWSARPDLSSQVSTDYSLTLRQTDIAGNVSASSGPWVIEVLPPTVPDMEDTSDSGLVGDGLTRIARPEFSGSLPAGIADDASVVLLINGSVVVTGSGTGTFDGLALDYGEGTWSYVPPADLDDGSYALSLRIGGVLSSEYHFEIDTQIPQTLTIDPEINALWLGNLDGNGAQGGVIAHTFSTEATIAGWVYIGNADGTTATGQEAQVIFATEGDLEVTIASGGSIQLQANGVAVDTGFTATLGWHYVAVTRTPSGQSFYFDGAASQASFSVAAASPAGLRLGLGSGPGDRPLIGGGLRDLQVWDRALDQSELEAARTGGIVDLQDTDLVGYWPLSGTGGDAMSNSKDGGPDVGKVGNASVSPVPDGTGFEGIVTVGLNPLVSGSGAIPFTTVTVTVEWDGGSTVLVTQADELGNWSIQPGLEPEVVTDYTITASHQDAAGNSYSTQSPLRVSRDAIALPILDAASDTGVAGDNITLADSPEIRGFLPTGFTLEQGFVLYINGMAVASTTGDTTVNGLTVNMADREWSYVPETPLAPGEYAFSFTVNGEASGTLTVEVTAVPPPALHPDSDSGVSQTDSLTRDTTPTLVGTLPEGIGEGTAVALLMAGSELTSGSTSGTHNGLTIDYENRLWSFTPPSPLAEGEYAFVLRIAGFDSDPLPVEIDLTADDAVMLAPPENEIRAVSISNSGQTTSGQYMYVNVGGSGDMTLGGWVYISETDAWQSIHDTTSELDLKIAPNGSIRSGGIDTGFVATAGWHFFALVGDATNGTHTVIWDGQQSSKTFSFASSDLGRKHSFGASLNLTNDTFSVLENGAYSGIGIWNRALSDDELARFAGGQVDDGDTTLLGYWSLNGTDANAVLDGPPMQRWLAGFDTFSATQGYTGPAQASVEDGLVVLSGSGAVAGNQVRITVRNANDSVALASVDGPSFSTYMQTGNAASSDRGGLTLDHEYSGVGSVAGWVYIANPTGQGMDDNQRIVHTYRDMSLRIEKGTGKIELYSFKTGAKEFQDTGFVATAGWHFFVISDGQDDKNFYWDGVASSTSLNTANSERTNIHFGRHAANQEGALDGAFRDIQFWDRALTAEEVQRYYAGEGVDLNDPDLVGFWALDEASGTTNAVQGGPDLTKQGGAAIGIQQELTVVADAQGNWQGDIALEDGTSYDISVVQVDAAGNPSDAVYTTIDVPVIPSAPNLLAGSDSGAANNDDVTDDATPDLTGTLPAGTVQGAPVALYMNGTLLTAATDGTAELSVDYASETWTYTPPNALSDGEYEFMVTVDGIESLPLIVTVDTTAPTAPVTVNPPALVEAATFDGNTLTISGTFADDVSEMVVSWSDGNPGSLNDPSAEAQIDTATGTWTASFSLAEMQGMTDGLNLTFTLAAKDLAGNEADLVTSGPVALELENQAPVENDQQPISTVLVGSGAAGGTPILDLEDLSGDGGATINDTAFADGDAPGSLHGELTYSSSNLPAWLTLTSDGILRIADGETAPDIDTPITITVTATDGTGSGVSRDIELDGGVPVTLASDIANVTNVDARSNIVLSSSEGLRLTNADATYFVRLTEQSETLSKSGFAGEDRVSWQTIEVTVVDGDASFDGGSISIVDGKAVIDFDHDFDLSNNYSVQIDAGLFRGAATGLQTVAVGEGELTFSTVTPDIGGQTAKVFEGTTLVDGAVWYDGTGGDYFGNAVGLNADLSGTAGVVVIGRDTDLTSGAELNTGSRTMLTGFGRDDLIYIDSDFDADPNVLTIDTISVDDGGGSVPTELGFAAEEDAAGVLIQFEDRAETTVDESGLTAVAFQNADIGSGEHSFESLTGNGTPVIGG